MLLEVDYRESKIIELLKLNNDETLFYEIKNLIIGDFIIRNDNYLYVIERKSVLDLSASIIDGRMSEQRDRINNSFSDTDTKNIVYIIEGDRSKITNLPKNTIDSVILNLIFKYKYYVIFTKDIQETNDYLILLYNKIKENIFEKTNITNFTPIKKSDKNQKNAMLNMLTMIPGVSPTIAIKINDKFKTIKELCNNITEDSLASIQLTEKRKLGKALSLKIYNSLNL